MTISPTKANLIPETLNFVLKLARAENLSEDEAVETIVDQITAMEQASEFPAFFNIIDPDTFHSETKLLPPYAQARLSSALRKYRE